MIVNVSIYWKHDIANTQKVSKVTTTHFMCDVFMGQKLNKNDMVQSMSKINDSNTPTHTQTKLSNLCTTLTY